MSDCPEPQKLACMEKLRALQQGQTDLRAWMQTTSAALDEQGKDIAFMRGKLCAERKRTGKMVAALTVLFTAIAAAVASIWQGNK